MIVIRLHNIKLCFIKGLGLPIVCVRMRVRVAQDVPLKNLKPIGYHQDTVKPSYDITKFGI